MLAEKSMLGGENWVLGEATQLAKSKERKKRKGG